MLKDLAESLRMGLLGISDTIKKDTAYILKREYEKHKENMPIQDKAYILRVLDVYETTGHLVL